MCKSFPLLSDLIRNVELAMAKADLTIAHTVRHAGSGCRHCANASVNMLAEEFHRTRQMILSLTGQKELLEE